MCQYVSGGVSSKPSQRDRTNISCPNKISKIVYSLINGIFFQIEIVSFRHKLVFYPWFEGLELKDPFPNLSYGWIHRSV